MRATSVIFLVLSILLALCGVVVCGIGASMAEEQGIALFDQVADANDNLITTYNYTGDGIKKIAVEVGECDVHVYGSSETAYIELINFTEGSYDLSSTNLTLSVVDNSNLLKLFAWGSEGINFHGFRHYLKALDFGDKPRTVNIYLTDDSAVKQFDLKVGTGNLHMQELRFTFDLTAGVGTGELKLENMITTSDITLTSGQGSVKLDNVTSRTMSVTGDRTDLTMKSCYTLRGMTLATVEGSVKLGTIRGDFDDYNVDLYAPGGKIDYFGQAYDKNFTHDGSEDPEYFLKITAERGSIAVAYEPGEAKDEDEIPPEEG